MTILPLGEKETFPALPDPSVERFPPMVMSPTVEVRLMPPEPVVVAPMVTADAVISNA